MTDDHAPLLSEQIADILRKEIQNAKLAGVRRQNVERRKGKSDLPPFPIEDDSR